MTESGAVTWAGKEGNLKKNKDSAPALGTETKTKRKTAGVREASNKATATMKKKKVCAEGGEAPATIKQLSKKKGGDEQNGAAGPNDGPQGGEVEGAGLESSVKKAKIQQPESMADPKKQGKKRRRRGKTVVEGEELTAAELERRQRQRELRALALKMREEGIGYKRPPTKKPKVESQKAGLYSASQVQGAAQQSDEEGTRPAHPVQVIVVPIYWNRKPEEKAQVIRAAEAAMMLLQAAGVTAGIDTTNAMSPGQKYAFWEIQGVKVRIECGPKDVTRRVCVLAISKKAGELAERQTDIPVGPDLVRKVGAALGMDVNLPIPGQAGNLAGGILAADGATLGVLGAKRVAASGDDLRGDFGDLTVGNDESNKKKRKK